MKRMKKLIAALMAVAMIASLNISAFAQQTTPSPFDTNSNNPTGDASASANTEVGNWDSSNIANSALTTAGGYSASVSNGTFDKARASITSPVAYEGKMPEGIVHIVMPTVTTTTFNMLLDPNNLIGEVAAGGENATQRITGITANSDYVYFANAADSENNIEAGWSSSSDKMTITNKGTWPLSVKLTAEVQKGDTAATGSLIQLVDNKSKLSGNDLKDVPAMYMEIVNDKEAAKKGVVKDAYGTPSMAITNTAGDGPNLIVGTPIFTWDATNGGLNRDRKIINNALAGAALEVKSTSTGVTVLFKAANTNNTATTALGTTPAASYTVSKTGAYSADDSTMKIAIAASSVAAEKIDLSDGKGQIVGVYNIQFGEASATTLKTYATLKIAVDPVNVSLINATSAITAKNANNTITFAKNESNSTGSSDSIALNAATNAYIVSYESGAYTKKLTSAASESGYEWPKLSFNISAAINKTTAWDDLAGTTAYTVNANTGVKTKVIWDVANNYDGDTTINLKPKVKVLKYAVAVGDSIEFKIDFGKGSNAAIAIVGLDAGLSKISCPTFGEVLANATTAAGGKAATLSANQIAEYNNKDGKWQTFTTNTADGHTSNLTFQCSPKTVSAGASATLTYLKADLTTDTVTFTYGAANA